VLGTKVPGISGIRMAIKIGLNIPSLQAQRVLGDSTNALSRTFERLSSGQRINRASDDSAGLALSSSLNLDSRVFTQGVRNVNQGIDYLNIADSAVSELKKIAIRQQEMATQSSNGVYSDSQRSALDYEMQALMQEYNRIIDSTKYNGRQLFTGERGALVIQAGYDTLTVLEPPAASEGEAAVFETTRVSVDSAGTQGTGGHSYETSLSADGRFVAFRSEATNLVAGDTNAADDIFVHDRQTGTTTRVSVDSAGTQGNSYSYTPSISADGRYVAFLSNASNLVAGDTNASWDIFVHDRQTGTTTRVSVDSTGTQGNGASAYHPSLSADGRFVAFLSEASNLVAGDTNGRSDIFVHDRQTGTTTRVSVDSAGTQGTGGHSYTPSISADGRYVAFASTATNLVAGDTNGTGDIFVHDRQTGFVAFFSYATNLVAGDTNGLRDIFVHDRQTGTTIRVSVDSAGTQGNGNSFAPSISADGRFVALCGFFFICHQSCSW